MLVIVVVVMIIVIAMVMVVIIVAAAVQAGAMRMATGELMAVAGQAIGAVLLGEGGSQIALVANPAGSQGAGKGVVIRAVQTVFVAVGNAIVVAATGHGFQTQGELARADRDADHTGIFVVHRAVAVFDDAFAALGRDAGRDLLVQKVDRAADGTAAIEQGRRAAQDLDAFQQQGLARNGVVR